MFPVIWHTSVVIFCRFCSPCLKWDKYLLLWSEMVVNRTKLVIWCILPEAGAIPLQSGGEVPSSDQQSDQVWNYFIWIVINYWPCNHHNHSTDIIQFWQKLRPNAARGQWRTSTSHYLPPLLKRLGSPWCFLFLPCDGHRTWRAGAPIPTREFRSFMVWIQVSALWSVCRSNSLPRR